MPRSCIYIYIYILCEREESIERERERDEIFRARANGFLSMGVVARFLCCLMVKGVAKIRGLMLFSGLYFYYLVKYASNNVRVYIIRIKKGSLTSCVFCLPRLTYVQSAQ